MDKDKLECYLILSEKCLLEAFHRHLMKQTLESINLNESASITNAKDFIQSTRFQTKNGRTNGYNAVYQLFSLFLNVCAIQSIILRIHMHLKKKRFF